MSFLILQNIKDVTRLLKSRALQFRNTLENLGAHAWGISLIPTFEIQIWLQKFLKNANHVLKTDSPKTIVINSNPLIYNCDLKTWKKSTKKLKNHFFAVFPKSFLKLNIMTLPKLRTIFDLTFRICREKSRGCIEKRRAYSFRVWKN